MKFIVLNKRTNKIEAEYEDLEMAQCLVKVGVKFKNDKKSVNEKRWTKKDFQIIEVK